MTRADLRFNENSIYINYAYLPLLGSSREHLRIRGNHNKKTVETNHIV